MRLFCFIISLQLCCQAAEAHLCREVFQPVTRWHQNRWTADKIVQVILAFKDSGLPVYSAAVKQGGAPYQEILTATLGYRGSLKRLVESKPEPGWTWNRALERAGLNPTVERAFKKPWTAEEIVSVVRALHANGLPVHMTAVREGGDAYQNVVRAILGRPASLERMVNVKPEEGWTWQRAMERAGLRPTDHMAKKHVWTGAEIIALIQAFHRAGLSTSITTVRRGGESYQAIMQDVMGFSHGTQGLIYAKPVPLWTWTMARDLAGLGPRRSLLPVQGWDATRILMAIQAFHKNGLSLDPSRVRNGGEPYQAVLHELFGFAPSLNRITLAKPTPDWTWPRAVLRAGLDPVLLLNPRHAWTADEIVTAIQKMDAAGLPINFKAVQQGSDVYQRLFVQEMGINASGRSLTRARPEDNWSWDVALVRAGFNPNHVRRWGSAPLHLLTAEMRAEFGSNYESLYGNYTRAIEGRGPEDFDRVAVERTDMDELMHQRQVSSTMQKVTEELSPREQQILEGLLDYVVREQDFNRAAMLDSLRRDIPDLQRQEILDVMQSIRENPEIAELMKSPE